MTRTHRFSDLNLLVIDERVDPNDWPELLTLEFELPRAVSSALIFASSPTADPPYLFIELWEGPQPDPQIPVAGNLVVFRQEAAPDGVDYDSFVAVEQPFRHLVPVHRAPRRPRPTGPHRHLVGRGASMTPDGVLRITAQTDVVVEHADTDTFWLKDAVSGSIVAVPVRALARSVVVDPQPAPPSTPDPTLDEEPEPTRFVGRKLVPVSSVIIGAALVYQGFPLAVIAGLGFIAAGLAYVHAARGGWEQEAGPDPVGATNRSVFAWTERIGNPVFEGIALNFLLALNVALSTFLAPAVVVYHYRRRGMRDAAAWSAVIVGAWIVMLCLAPTMGTSSGSGGCSSEPELPWHVTTREDTSGFTHETPTPRSGSTGRQPPSTPAPARPAAPHRVPAGSGLSQDADRVVLVGASDRRVPIFGPWTATGAVHRAREQIAWGRPGTRGTLRTTRRSGGQVDGLEVEFADGTVGHVDASDAGYLRRVARVRSDDTLNVRTGRSHKTDKVGEIPPAGPVFVRADQADTVAACAALSGPSKWWRVRTLDGVEGYVNCHYLGPF